MSLCRTQSFSRSYNRVVRDVDYMNEPGVGVRGPIGRFSPPSKDRDCGLTRHLQGRDKGQQVGRPIESRSQEP